jgi:hypothetical protein
LAVFDDKTSAMHHNVVRYNDKHRAPNIPCIWPSIEYISLKLKGRVTMLEIRAAGHDHGWGNSGSSHLKLALMSFSERCICDEMIIELRHPITAGFLTEMTDEFDKFLIHSRKGSILRVINVCAPWCGFESHCTHASIQVKYAHQDRYYMVVTRALVLRSVNSDRDHCRSLAACPALHFLMLSSTGIFSNIVEFMQ